MPGAASLDPIRALAPHEQQRFRTLADLPGVVPPVVALPGGGIVATVDPERASHRVAVACDLDPGFGFRICRTGLTEEIVARAAAFLADDLARTIPAGPRAKGLVRVDIPRLHRVLRHGARWVVHQGIGTRADLDRILDGGAIATAEPEALPLTVRRDLLGDLGALGSGEAGLDLLVAEGIDAGATRRWQIRNGEVLLVVRCGSRALGRRFLESQPPGEGPPLASPEGRTFLEGLAAVTNYALANRQIVATLASRSVARCVRGAEVRPLCDLLSDHTEVAEAGGGRGGERLLVHRGGALRLADMPGLLSAGLGATLALLASPEPPRNLPIPARAARTLAPDQTSSHWSAQEVAREMARRGVTLRYASAPAAETEAPWAYCAPGPAEQSLEEAGLASRVGLLRPLLAVRG